MPIRAYLDTVIISGLARGDVGQSELDAIGELQQAFDDGHIELFTSEKVGEELEKIPSEHRDAHLTIYELFRNIPKVHPGSSTQLGPHALAMSNPRNQTWKRLNSVLPDEADCEHLLSAQYNRLQYFVTLDAKTILKHREALRGIIGVRPVRPSEFCERLQRSEA